ncbi:proteasome accessory factor PafA2 [Mycobacterium kansasii]|uniref:Proteasome accessory factor PafA2 n=1 Tax=Mycobacterium kansasii TaxID=1768 RepID=A0A1V3X3F9_MYCKA|nr:proteasome accessory factor PafA2 [Mycobacterium kansasii]
MTNGARLYVDHAHPEYSAPECTDPLDAVIWDKAGERVMEAAARHVASVPGAAKLQLYKNNVDGKGASYGAHENYLMSRQTPFSAIIAGLTPFLVSRQVVTGSGRVGIGPSGDEPGFQLSQRADYIEVEVGLETTLKRGIINTRDEPHADADRYRRLHVIIGDANLAETSTYLKLGATALVLDLIEEGVDLADLALARPVHAVHAISRDPTLRATVALVDGREMTGLALQRAYLDRVAKLVDSRDPDPRASDIVETWTHVLDLLERDPMECAELLDWPAKLRLLDGFRHRENLSWSAPRLHLVDLQYSDVRLDKGLYNRLVARGSMKRLVSEHQVLEAVDNPPPTPGRTSAANVCAGSAPISPPPAGTRSFSIWAVTRWCGYPRSSRCGAAKPTSARCWSPWTAPPNWWNNSPAEIRWYGRERKPGNVGADRYC